MIHLKLGIHDIGLICIVLADVIESREFVDNHELQKIHDKLKDSILYKINPDNEKNKNEIEFLKADSINKLKNHLKNIQKVANDIESNFADDRFKHIHSSINQILNIHIRYLKQ